MSNSVSRKVLRGYFKEALDFCPRFVPGKDHRIIALDTLFSTAVEYLDQRSSEHGYMVSVEGQAAPKQIHYGFLAAESEAKRLSKLNPGKEVIILSVTKKLKAEVVVKDVTPRTANECYMYGVDLGKSVAGSKF